MLSKNLQHNSHGWRTDITFSEETRDAECIVRLTQQFYMIHSSQMYVQHTFYTHLNVLCVKADSLKAKA